MLFDAHLDLAYLAENGRDMACPLDVGAGPHPPAAVTFPELTSGGVTACLGTIFTEAGGTDAVAYPMGDAHAAHAAGMRQLEQYQRWNSEGLIRLSRRPGSEQGGPVSVGILMECADPIRTPDELDWWADRGVIAVGMAWARGSRYATGNSPDSFGSGVGLTDIGRELVRRIDARALIHDASHLSDRALDDLLSLTTGRVMASHSNCRALLSKADDPRLLPRHLADAQIEEITRRGGVIGLNLYGKFLNGSPDRRPTLDDAVAHIEHICRVAGHRNGVGLGSDLDGGFSADKLPQGITRARDLPRLLDALRAKGWNSADAAGFAFKNWGSFLSP
jgi:membrane dipeptidase